MASKPWFFAAVVSWGIALFEYLLQVPANRVGAEIFPSTQSDRSRALTLEEEQKAGSPAASISPCAPLD